MGSVWSKIVGSGYPNCCCGIFYISNCHQCGIWTPGFCGGWEKYVFYIIDGAIIFLGIVLIALLSDALMGDEEGLNLIDDMATFSEGGMMTLLKFWKSTMGEIHTTVFNIFSETLHGSPALSKLVAATLTSAVGVTLLDLFDGQMQKLKDTCVADIFTVLNTPINFLKAELYNFYKPLGYIADIFMIPFEIVVAFISIITTAIWDFLKKTGLGNLLCSSGSNNPCCQNL